VCARNHALAGDPPGLLIAVALQPGLALRPAQLLRRCQVLGRVRRLDFEVHRASGCVGADVIVDGSSVLNCQLRVLLYLQLDVLKVGGAVFALGAAKGGLEGHLVCAAGKSVADDVAVLELALVVALKEGLGIVAGLAGDWDFELAHLTRADIGLVGLLLECEHGARDDADHGLLRDGLLPGAAFQAGVRGVGRGGQGLCM
jgi:hypothetical protein